MASNRDINRTSTSVKGNGEIGLAWAHFITTVEPILTQNFLLQLRRQLAFAGFFLEEISEFLKGFLRLRIACYVPE